MEGSPKGKEGSWFAEECEISSQSSGKHVEREKTEIVVGATNGEDAVIRAEEL